MAGTVLMRGIALKSLNDLVEWRDTARALLLDTAPPEEVVWSDPVGPQGLTETSEISTEQAARRPVGTVPKAFMALAADAICNSNPERFALLYRLLWRLQENRGLMGVAADPDIAGLTRLANAVRRDSHKMRAFVRFRKIIDGSGEVQLIDWFEPEHYVLESVAPFFREGFNGTTWTIVTPYRSAFWDRETLRFGPGGRKGDLPAGGGWALQQDGVHSDVGLSSTNA